MASGISYNILKAVLPDCLDMKFNTCVSDFDDEASEYNYKGYF